MSDFIPFNLDDEEDPITQPQTEIQPKAQESIIPTEPNQPIQPIQPEETTEETQKSSIVYTHPSYNPKTHIVYTTYRNQYDDQSYKQHIVPFDELFTKIENGNTVLDRPIISKKDESMCFLPTTMGYNSEDRETFLTGYSAFSKPVDIFSSSFSKDESFDIDDIIVPKRIDENVMYITALATDLDNAYPTYKKQLQDNKSRFKNSSGSNAGLYLQCYSYNDAHEDHLIKNKFHEVILIPPTYFKDNQCLAHLANKISSKKPNSFGLYQLLDTDPLYKEVEQVGILKCPLTGVEHDFKGRVLAKSWEAYTGVPIDERQILNGFLLKQILDLDKLKEILSRGILATTNVNVYSTFSSTDEIPRYRAIIQIDSPIPVDNYKRVFKALIHLVPEADPSCGNPSRIFYGPSIKEGTKATKGKGLFFGVRKDKDPLDVSKFLADYDKTIAEERSKPKETPKDLPVVDALLDPKAVVRASLRPSAGVTISYDEMVEFTKTIPELAYLGRSLQSIGPGRETRVRCPFCAIGISSHDSAEDTRLIHSKHGKIYIKCHHGSCDGQLSESDLKIQIWAAQLEVMDDKIDLSSLEDLLEKDSTALSKDRIYKLTLEDYKILSCGDFSSTVDEFIVKGIDGLGNVLVMLGPTGSGKTTKGKKLLTDINTLPRPIYAAYEDDIGVMRRHLVGFDTVRIFVSPYNEHLTKMHNECIYELLPFQPSQDIIDSFVSIMEGSPSYDKMKHKLHLVSTILTNNYNLSSDFTLKTDQQFQSIVGLSHPCDSKAFKHIRDLESQQFYLRALPKGIHPESITYEIYKYAIVDGRIVEVLDEEGLRSRPKQEVSLFFMDEADKSLESTHKSITLTHRQEFKREESAVTGVKETKDLYLSTVKCPMYPTEGSSCMCDNCHACGDSYLKEHPIYHKIEIVPHSKVIENGIDKSPRHFTFYNIFQHDHNVLDGDFVVRNEGSHDIIAKPLKKHPKMVRELESLYSQKRRTPPTQEEKLADTLYYQSQHSPITKMYFDVHYDKKYKYFRECQNKAIQEITNMSTDKLVDLVLKGLKHKGTATDFEYDAVEQRVLYVRKYLKVQNVLPTDNITEIDKDVCEAIKSLIDQMFKQIRELYEIPKDDDILHYLVPYVACESSFAQYFDLNFIKYLVEQSKKVILASASFSELSMYILKLILNKKPIIYKASPKTDFKPIHSVLIMSSIPDYDLTESVKGSDKDRRTKIQKEICEYIGRTSMQYSRECSDIPENALDPMHPERQRVIGSSLVFVPTIEKAKKARDENSGISPYASVITSDGVIEKDIDRVRKVINYTHVESAAARGANMPCSHGSKSSYKETNHKPMVSRFGNVYLKENELKDINDFSLVAQCIGRSLRELQHPDGSFFVPRFKASRRYVFVGAAFRHKINPDKNDRKNNPFIKESVHDEVITLFKESNSGSVRDAIYTIDFSYHIYDRTPLWLPQDAQIIQLHYQRTGRISKIPIKDTELIERYYARPIGTGVKFAAFAKEINKMVEVASNCRERLKKHESGEKVLKPHVLGKCKSDWASQKKNFKDLMDAGLRQYIIDEILSSPYCLRSFKELERLFRCPFSKEEKTALRSRYLKHNVIKISDLEIEHQTKAEKKG